MEAFRQNAVTNLTSVAEACGFTKVPPEVLEALAPLYPHLCVFAPESVIDLIDDFSKAEYCPWDKDKTITLHQIVNVFHDLFMAWERNFERMEWRRNHGASR